MFGPCVMLHPRNTARNRLDLLCLESFGQRFLMQAIRVDFVCALCRCGLIQCLTVNRSVSTVC